MTEPTNSTTPTTPTAGQRLDAGIAWTKAEWTKRNAASPKFKWIALGTTAVAGLLALLLVAKVGSAIFGPSFPGKPSKDTFDRLTVGMKDDQIDKLLGAPNEHFYVGYKEYSAWIIDEKTAILLQSPGTGAMAKRWDTAGEWKLLKSKSEAEKEEPNSGGLSSGSLDKKLESDIESRILSKIPSGQWTISDPNNDQNWNFTVDGQEIKGVSYSFAGPRGAVKISPQNLSGSSIVKRGGNFVVELGSTSDGSVGSFELTITGTSIAGKTIGADVTSSPVIGRIVPTSP